MHNLQERGRKVIEIVNGYKSDLNSYQSHYNKLRDSCATLKSMVDMSPEATEITKELQLLQHEESVGVYEKLLTSLLTEVMPGYREIVLDLKTLRQAPALDVMIKKSPDKPPEDVIRGTGGSVTNIVVAGFRIISVIRSGKRKFLLMDEADCWLEEGNFPAFSKMLKDVSESLGVQILLISHDKNSYFSGVIEHQVEIYKDNNDKIQSRFRELPEWNNDDDIIKSIRLENFQSHEDTFIPLSSTITMLRGGNDLGKSSIASALRAVFYGDGASSDIKHFTNQSTVTIEFSKDNRFLVWERRSKGKPVESYTLYSGLNNEPLHKTEGLSKDSVPDWMMKETGMGTFDKLDVQLTWQKDPLAFLNLGPHVRAKALSVGTDDDYIQKMMEVIKKDNTKNKATLKSSELLLESQRQTIIPLKKVNYVEDEYIKNCLEKLENLNKKNEKLEKLLTVWEKINQYECLMNLSHNINIDDIKIVNRGNNISNIEKIVKDWSKNENLNSSLKNIVSIKTIDIKIDEPKYPFILKLYNSYFRELNINEIYKKIEYQKDLTINNSKNELILKLEKIISSIEQRENFINILKEIEDVKTINEIKDYKRKMMDIAKFGQKWGVFLKENLLFDNLKGLNTLDIKISDKKYSMSNMEKIITDLTELKNRSDNAEIVINEVLKEKELLELKIKEDFPVCPTCNRIWDHEHN